MQIANAIAIILSEYSTKEVHKREKIWFSSWNNNKYILRLKRAKREEAKKKCMRARNARSRERRIGPLSSLLNRNDRGAQ